MRANSFLLFLLLCSFCGSFLSCQEETALDDLGLEGADFSDTPVFEFSDTESGVEIKAGVNDFYMYPTYDTLSDGRIIFNSQFIKLTECISNCAEALRIYIQSRNATYTNGDIVSNGAIMIGDYPFSNAAQSIADNEVIVEYTALDGITYRTDRLEQPEQSFLKINSAIDYQKNENGDPTKLLEIELSCRLQATEGEAIFEFFGATGTIAIAFPE